MALDVLEHGQAWPQDRHSLDHVGPEVAGVVGAETLAGVAKWLARIPATDDVHGFDGGPVHGGHVPQVGHVRPVVGEDA